MTGQGGRRLRFLSSRLRTASWAELFHRLRETVLIASCKCQLRLGRSPCAVPFIDHEDLALLKMPPVEVHLPPATVLELLQGAVWTLNAQPAEIRDFEERVAGTFFSDISYPIDPDVRAVWEPARLQHATALFLHADQALVSEHAGKCRDRGKMIVLGWIENNPFLHGPHFRSAMECALRIPVFLWAMKMASLDAAETALVCAATCQHAWWIERRLSLYSSLGNHTICEAVGLVFSGALFRKTREGGRWLKRGIALLQQELPHQILPDGGPAEQSLNYHRFVLDLYWLTVSFLEENSLYDCSEIKRHLERGELFLAAFTADCRKPAIGDSDDGHALAPGISPLRSKTVSHYRRFEHFPHAGYSVIRPAEGTVITFDHGPLGMAPLYNHGHADALSLTLGHQGEQFLVDPGTYRYNGAPELRAYFKGTRAHNTVTIDGIDQAVQVTGFIWNKPFESKLLRKEVTDRGILLEASHTGYARLGEPVIHTRALWINDRHVVIKDVFSGRGCHTYELNFHLHPDAEAEETDGFWQVKKSAGCLFIGLLANDSLRLVSGRECSPLGWNSPAYGVKRRSGVLQSCRTGRPEAVTFMTAIAFGSPPSVKEVELLSRAFPQLHL